MRWSLLFSFTSPPLGGSRQTIHEGKDPGVNNGDAIEKEITLSIANMTREILEDAGYKVKRNREDDDFVELTERPEIANRKNAKVSVSVNC